MRELRVVGVDTDGKRVICQDPETAERFVIAADERLRAAARGDISRLGQIQIEMESSLRPREIQARIRGGASVAEVAAIAGVTMERIERFAHPVLLERQRATELAALSHPLREDGPSAYTLAETVTEAFGAFGDNHAEVDWDAWKGDDGDWVIQLMWVVGHSDCYAHWRYRPGSHGGLTDPLDELAYEITHPELIEPRRRLAPVAFEQPAAPELVSATVADHAQPVRPTPESATGFPVARPDANEYGAGEYEADTYDAGETGAPAVTVRYGPSGTEPSDSGYRDESDTDDRRAAAPTPITRGRTLGRSDDAPVADRSPDGQTPTAPGIPRTGDHEEASHDEHGDDAQVKPRRKTRTPPVPAWEDVLLGVRGNGHS
ncbi:DUF3071 domain-containing protein [Gordonia pseudamarae]|uniref:DUF3071 domain-containing protein n=1 Tax=Gordonia pseudamarae TaxID=2831662 RepID=A0ABX6IG94_9ACTN|nr:MULTISPECIES: septation protein SepH [Gordonia]MBD0023642.1 DUF3071 domain-containing protein [Gordonia sp. (in: high G+C Gram-positive bacteria)]QHN25454.1 DUF3071 domain-containing protein [Gordonia pseudamarae]QHN34386.1 DUF3071 domain-containing protein [Gordonia pseudamarae]